MLLKNLKKVYELGENPAEIILYAGEMKNGGFFSGTSGGYEIASQNPLMGYLFATPEEVLKLEHLKPIEVRIKSTVSGSVFRKAIHCLPLTPKEKEYCEEKAKLEEALRATEGELSQYLNSDREIWEKELEQWRLFSGVEPQKRIRDIEVRIYPEGEHVSIHFWTSWDSYSFVQLIKWKITGWAQKNDLPVKKVVHG